MENAPLRKVLFRTLLSFRHSVSIIRCFIIVIIIIIIIIITIVIIIIT